MKIEPGEVKTVEMDCILSTDDETGRSTIVLTLGPFKNEERALAICECLRLPFADAVNAALTATGSKGVRHEFDIIGGKPVS